MVKIMALIKPTKIRSRGKNHVNTPTPFFFLPHHPTPPNLLCANEISCPSLADEAEFRS
jgi:hypothetical protein